MDVNSAVSPLDLTVGQLYKYSHKLNPEEKGFGRFVELWLDGADVTVTLTTTSLKNEKIVAHHVHLDSKNYYFFVV